MTSRQILGRWGETLAAQYLVDKGYLVLAVNVRTPYGEIDLIVRAPGEERSPLVFVEVKTRASRAFGLPEEAVTPKKQAHLIASAQHYLQTHPELEGDWRVDVIAIERAAAQPPRLTHFENAVTALP